MRYRPTNIITASVTVSLKHDCLATVPAVAHTDQDLAKGFVFQESQVFRQFTGIEVVEQQRHFPLFGHRWDTLGHLPLPFIGRTGRDKEKQTIVSFLRPVFGG